MSIIEDSLYLGLDKTILTKELTSRDLMLSSEYFLRIEKDRWTIHSLYSSDQIIIPKEHINLFLTMNRLTGDRLKSKDCESRIEKYIYFGTILVRMIYGGDKSKCKKNFIEPYKYWK